jgi:hypothetical protein
LYCHNGREWFWLKKIDEYFNLKRKAAAGIFALGFAALWLMLRNFFPMEWNSLFIDSSIGSNITLFLMFTVITLPMCWLFSRLTDINISFSFCCVVNIICMFSVVYMFSIFRYEHREWLILSLIVHAVLNALVVGLSRPYSKDRTTVILKSSPLLAVGTALLYTAFTDITALMLFYSMTYVFIQQNYQA